MDSTYSVGDVASALGTTAHRVRRARAHVGRNKERIPSSQLRELVTELGAAPVVDGLSREALFVLSALAQRPLGLRSARAVARAAGVSPTTATRLLRELEPDYVDHEREQAIEGGVREVDVWYANRISPAWRDVEDVVRSTVTPVGVRDQRPSTRVPRRLWHLFWNTDPAALDVRHDGAFIAHRLLATRDLQGLAWLASGAVSRPNLRKASEAKDLDDRQKGFALSIARRT